METKEFENIKVVYIPELELEGVVEYESDDKKKMTTYSTELDICWDKGLAVTEIIDSSVQVHEVTSDRKSEVINKILESNFSFCTFRSVVGDELYIKNGYYRVDSLVKMHLDKIRDFINNNKNNNKSMETEKIFIPFYLEYVKCLEPVNGNSPSIVFRAANGDIFYVSYRDGLISCSMMRYGLPSRFFGGKTIKNGDRESLKSLGKVLLDRSFDNIDFKLSWGYDDYTDRICKKDKDQFLLAILNCLDMNFSHKSMITDEVTKNWEDLRQFDMLRSEYFDSGSSNQPFDLPKAIWTKMIGIRLSNKIYEHFKNYRMRKEIDLGKIEGIRDVEDGINFVKLPPRRRVCEGDFDLIGLKESGGGEYAIVIREISKSDLNTCRYRSTSYIEKGEYVPILIDQNTNITSILIQFHVCEKFTEVPMDGEEVDVRDKHMHIIRSIISNGLDEEKEKEKEKEKDDNGETEEERISREFNVNCLVKIAEGIGKRIDRDRKYITSKNISPILDRLQSTIDYLKSLEQRD